MRLWLRLYVDIINSRKIATLDATVYRTWTFCLCAAKEGNGILPPLDQLAFLLRCDLSILQAQIEKLIEAKLIDRDGAKLTMHDWFEFQYDSPTERSQKHRKRVKQNADATPMQRACNTNATPMQRTEKSREEKSREEYGVLTSAVATPPQTKIPTANGTSSGFTSTAALIGRNLPGLLGERYSNQEINHAVEMLDQFRAVNQCHWPAPDAKLCHMLLDACSGECDTLFAFLKFIGKRKPGNGWGWLVAMARKQENKVA